MLLLTVLLALTSAEIEERPPNNIVVADVGLHVVGLGFQRSFGPLLAVQLTGSLYVPWTQQAGIAGLIARLRVFVYPSAHAPTGLWLSPFVQAGVVNQTVDGATQTGATLAAGASLGWAWLLFRHLQLAIGVGAQYHAAKFARAPGFDGLHPQVEANLGYAF